MGIKSSKRDDNIKPDNEKKDIKFDNEKRDNCAGRSINSYVSDRNDSTDMLYSVEDIIDYIEVKIVGNGLMFLIHLTIGWIDTELALPGGLITIKVKNDYLRDGLV